MQDTNITYATRQSAGARCTAREARPGLGTRLANVLLTWQNRATERTQLKGLSNAQLKDMGISRADAMREAAKPFWRA